MTRPAVRQAASLLLVYPGDDWPSRLSLVERTLGSLPRPAAEALGGFCAGAAGADPLRFAADYVATFDRSRRRTLHMTYYADGDTRRRGMSLARVKSVYLAAGWRPDDAELPDFLPLMLEFSARCPEPGERLLREHLPGLHRLRSALEDFRSPYAGVVGAVLTTLPEPAPARRRARETTAEPAPPVERVGLDVRSAGPRGGHR
ncbi:nitrate reductase molybdenum cofactor assembly chaperone [Microbispora sp. H10670]|uniref:nitrate reductase molybdenum cofactor assembly chaperone n=1 Tax=Microbispora sp. H10670 TaxID=2729108 RepID=UPI0016025EED|nr:nitrate reductase molybdenum cofactor assembly chaperone [Microbispora sp. H10670]